MASIHINEIQEILAKRGEEDAVPWNPGGFFLEIRFDNPNHDDLVVDEEMQNKVLTATAPSGIVTIQFDSRGELQSIDLS